jgi:nitric oxide reductase subunit C
MMGSLVAAFAIQTTLVYTDDTAEATEPLGEQALAGRAIWHENNCQTCHQIYGFGGFLGPDLTNAASRLTRERLDEILVSGSGQMPAFGFAPEQIDALQAFFAAVDRTGIGQARQAARRVDTERLAAVLDECATEGTLSEEAAFGRQVFRARCTSCHQLFQATPLGPFLAPDLTNVLDRLPLDEVRRTIVEGRPERGMIPPALPPEQLDAVLQFLTWMRAHRDDVAHRAGVDGSEEELPWFEYR